MLKPTLFFLIPLVVTSSVNAQHIAMTFQEASEKGITIENLDGIYQSAVNSDTSRAVFKTEDAQNKLVASYTKLLQDLGSFLSKNNFYWDSPAKCWNRVYFNNDGTIDYFLYNFLKKNVKPEDIPSPEKQDKFKQLLNAFIQDYKFPLTANAKFAQCSPVTYMPSKDN